MPRGTRNNASSNPSNQSGEDNSAEQPKKRGRPTRSSSAPKSPSPEHDMMLTARVASLEGEIGEIKQTSSDILNHLKLLSGEKVVPVPEQDPTIQILDPEVTFNDVAQVSRRHAARATPYPRPTAAVGRPPRQDDVFDLLNAAAVPSARGLPVSAQGYSDPAISAQVQTLLHTAQQLTSVKGRHTHPHHYVFRGPTRVKTTLRSLTPAEYIWGLFRLMKDPHTEPDVRPIIATHIYHVAEDAKDFSWLQVRDWSEEVLTKISEDLFSWFDEYDIKSLRDSGSRFKTGRLYAGELSDKPNEAKPKPRPPIRPPVSRPDVPCPAWNGVEGCTKQDGHLDKNVAQGHHCKFCRKHLNGVNYHPKVGCRNRGRIMQQQSTQPTFRQQAGYDRPNY